MNAWTIALIVIAAWCAVSVVVAFIVARAIRLRDDKERGPRGVPDYLPEDLPSSGRKEDH